VSPEQPPDLVRRNIERVLQLEEHASRARSPVDRVSDAVGRFVGTLTFVVLHLLAIAGWLALNLHAIPGVRPFDPPPFNLLSTIASCEAVFLTAFVLMKQSRESQLADRRDHLDLQVNLMAEQEASMIIQMLDRIGRKLGVGPEGSEDALSLSRTATLEHLVEQLHARLPDGEAKLPDA